MYIYTSSAALHAHILRFSVEMAASSVRFLLKMRTLQWKVAHIAQALPKVLNHSLKQREWSCLTSQHFLRLLYEKTRSILVGLLKTCCNRFAPN